MDDLSVKLQSMPIGYYINDTCFNHVMYADDAVLIAPSPSALQELVDVCQTFVTENDLQLNKTKSKFTIVKNEIIQGLAYMSRVMY
jgi:hypothetical protein